MRQLEPDHGTEPALEIQAARLRQEIGRYRQRLLTIDHPETSRFFQMLLNDAKVHLDRIEGRAIAFR